MRAGPACKLGEFRTPGRGRGTFERIRLALTSVSKEHEFVFFGEFGVDEVVLPTSGDLEHGPGEAFLAEADFRGEAEAGVVPGDDVGLDAVEAEAGGWRAKGEIEHGGDGFSTEAAIRAVDGDAPAHVGALEDAADDVVEIDEGGDGAGAEDGRRRAGKPAPLGIFNQFGDAPEAGAVALDPLHAVEFIDEILVEGLARLAEWGPGCEVVVVFFVDPDEVGAVGFFEWAEEEAGGGEGEAGQDKVSSVGWAGRNLHLRRTGSAEGLPHR